MNLASDKRLNIELRLDFSSAPTGDARQAGWEDIESLSVVNEPERPANTNRIMEEVCERANLKEALRQVRGNKGSAGVDRMTVDQLGDYLKQHWPAIREQLLNGTYEPKPVRRVEIPKPEGGVRKLGIPTVLDRLRWNSTFSQHSYGFRPTVSAGESVERFARNKLPGNLPFEFDAMGAMFGHGFHPLKARQPRSTPNLQSVRCQGRTPIDAPHSTTAMFPSHHTVVSQE